MAKMNWSMLGIEKDETYFIEAVTSIIDNCTFFVNLFFYQFIILAILERYAVENRLKLEYLSYYRSLPFIATLQEAA